MTMATQFEHAQPTAGPNLILAATLLSLAYLGDLLLTMAGHHFYSTRLGAHELNPAVSTYVDAGSWAFPALLKLLGLLGLWLGVIILRQTPWRGRYAWLLGAFATFYLMLDLYQTVMIHAIL